MQAVESLRGARCINHAVAPRSETFVTEEEKGEGGDGEEEWERLERCVEVV